MKSLFEASRGCILYKNGKLLKGWYCLFIFGFALGLSACRTGPFQAFKPASPHEQYEKRLINMGLQETVMGRAWIKRGKLALEQYQEIKLPYRESGYLDPAKVSATAFSFKLTQGQRLEVKLLKRPPESFRMFIDLWEKDEKGKVHLVAFADSLDSLEKNIGKTGNYILRLQPELISGGEYTLEIRVGPSLNYPLNAYRSNQIRSFIGEGRDDDSRKHEGIDIFADFRTPVLAIAPGIITRVNTNNLGGKVVWLRPQGTNFNINAYYAHLDEQTVTEGQRVMAGDTVGLMGNTGNARTTPPHLHFGLYSSDGPIDPVPYVRPGIKTLPAIQVDTGRINSYVRSLSNTQLIEQNEESKTLKNGTILYVLSATQDMYKVELPDGRTAFVKGNKVTAAGSPLRIIRSDSAQQPVYDRPDSLAAVKLKLQKGQRVDVLGNFEGFQYIRTTGGETGWLRL